jgi:hypothetical protein
MRVTCFGLALKAGLDLNGKEVSCGENGGGFQDREVGQKLMVRWMLPVSVMENRRRGAWGISLLAAYMWQEDGSFGDF